MNKDVARQIGTLMRECEGNFEKSVELITAYCDEDEALHYRAAMGKILGEILLQILNPIYSDYPDLRPPRLS